MPNEEADSLCDSFAQPCSPENLPERTINKLTNMVPERVRTVTTATYEEVDTDQEFTISELEDVLDRLKDTAPGEDTVCNLMIMNTPLSTRPLFIQPINQSLSEGRLPTRLYRSQIKTKRIVPSHYFRLFRKSWNDWCSTELIGPPIQSIRTL